MLRALSSSETSVWAKAPRLNWENDHRISKGENGTAIIDLKNKLSAQAISLTSSQKSVESMVVDARLNFTSNDH
jgi:hypothetical protein